jgi:hypothetical protein
MLRVTLISAFYAMWQFLVMWAVCEKASDFDFNIFKVEVLLDVYKS